MKKRWFLRRKAQQNAQPEADESTCAEAVSEETADNAETQSDANGNGVGNHPDFYGE